MALSGEGAEKVCIVCIAEVVSGAVCRGGVVSGAVRRDGWMITEQKVKGT